MVVFRLINGVTLQRAVALYFVDTTTELRWENGQHDFIYSAALPLNTGVGIKKFYLNST